MKVSLELTNKQKAAMPASMLETALYELSNLVLDSLVDKLVANKTAIDMLDLIQTWDSTEYKIDNSDFVSKLPENLRNAVLQSREFSKSVEAKDYFAYLLCSVVDPKLAEESKALAS
jgi:hypothetical protein